MTKLPLTNEIVTCLISSGIKPDNIEALRAGPKDFLEALLKSRLSAELKVEMVENTKGNMHLGLPYYANVDRLKNLRNSYVFRIVNRLKNLFMAMKARSHA